MSHLLYSLKPSTETAKINAFLEEIDIANWKVHPKLIEFNDAADWQKKIALLCSKGEKAEIEEHVIQNQVDDIANADVLSNSIKSLKQSRSVLILYRD